MINLTVVIDNDEALKKLKELQKVAKQSTSSVVSDAERMDSAFNSVKGSIAELAGTAALGGFVNKVIQVRGEVQQLEVAFETMLGSKAKAEALMSDVINLAAKTPFGLQDVSNATKMLLAYGSTAENVADEIKMLGNIASGLSIPLNDLIYLYGTTRTQGRMFTQDLRQFMGRGIPLAEELAKQFGVTKDEVGALVTAGKVGFPEMQKALQGMTSEGGQFFNLMEKQSQTNTGQISNLEDNIYQMFNAIGELQQGTISKGISMVSTLVENYEKVIDVISHLIIVYGSYKAAVMAVAAAQSVASMLKMVKTLYDVAKGAQTAAAAFSLLSGSTKGWVGLATGVISAIGILMMDFGQKAEKATETMGELEQAARNEQLEVNKLVYQLKQASTSEEERASILERLNRIAPSIVEGINDESYAFENLTDKLEEYNKEQIKRIQLASLADRQNQAINDYASADLAYKEYTKAVEARMAKLVAEYTSSGMLPDVKFNYDRENALPYAMREGYEAEIRKRIKEALEQASLGELNGVKLAVKLYEIAGGSGTDIAGYDEDFIGSKLSKLYWDREKKKKQLDSTTKNVEWLQSLLGDEGQDNTEDEQSELNDTKQYLEEKRAAYEAWITELKKLQAIERGEVQATADEYKKQKEKEADARKKYEALGGVTKRTGKENNEAEKKRIELNNALLKADEEYAQAVVDQMEEGEEKKLAQIEVNYQKEKNAINKEVEELKKLQGGSLTSEQVAKFDERYSALKAERQRNIADVAADERKAMNEYLAEYGTYQEKRLAITELYAEKIAEATNEWERKTLEKERDAELKALDETMAEKSDLWVRLFGNAEKMSRRQLKSVLADTKQLLDYLRGASDIKPIGFTEEQLKALKDDAEIIGAIYDELYEKQEEMERRNQYPFSNIINALKKLKEAREAEAEAEKEQNAESRQRKLESAESLRQEAGELGKIAASKAADTVTEIADAFKRLAEATDNANLKETAEQLGAFAQNLSAAGQGAASGGWIGAIVGGVSDMLMQTIDAIIGKQAEVHEYEQNRLDFMRQYQLMLLELNDSDYDSVFGTASLRKASDAWEKMAEAERLYKEATEGALGQFGGKMKEIANAGVGAFLYAPSLLDSRTTEEYKAYLEALLKGYNALEGMRVKTVDRSGWANFWGAKDEYANLKDLAPELWGEDGLFNADAARAFLETNTQITDEQRKQIQNAIDLKDKYDEALSEIDQQIEDVFGGLASDLSDIIFDSVRNGTDAWDEFGKKGAEIIDALGKQMLQELIMTQYLEQYTDDLRAAFASGDSSQIAAVVNNIFDNMGMMFEGMSAAAQAWDANAEEMGFDMNNISKTTTTSRGFQTMSQETGSELNGRFTDIQGQTHRISEAVEFIKSLNASQLQQTTSISETVALIRTDTIRIAENTSVLTQMAADISSIKSDISNGGY